jgi:hypothetical protein
LIDPAEIIDVKEESLYYVHFDDFDKRLDKWVP